MKAIVYREYGTADVLKLADVPKPAPQDGEVLVAIQAASLNFGDGALLAGKPFLLRLAGYGLFKPKYPILGTDIAGRVEAAGKNARQFQPGDEVYADLGNYGLGAFADFAVIPEQALALKPANVTFEQAAAVPQAAVVALQGLRDAGQIRPGQKVLINGASGGIGTFAVQIARAFGAEVTGVCSRPNLRLVTSLGAAQVIDYAEEDFTKNDLAYDLILDIVANRSVSDYMRVLRPNGRYVACAFNPTTLFLGPFISRDGKRAISLRHKPTAADLVFMAELLEGGQVVPVIDRCYSLAELPEAMRYLTQGQHHGKVVITVTHHGNGPRRSTWPRTEEGSAGAPISS